MGKVVIKILQGSAVTQTMLGRLTIYPPVANFLQCICAKNYENWLAVDKVITKIIRLTFFGPPCSSTAKMVVGLHVAITTYCICTVHTMSQLRRLLYANSL